MKEKDLKLSLGRIKKKDLKVSLGERKKDIELSLGERQIVCIKSKWKNPLIKSRLQKTFNKNLTRATQSVAYLLA